MNDVDRISLTSAIASLGRQITEAAEHAQGRAPGEPRFRLTSVELELTVVAEDTASGGGEVGWWILKGRAEATLRDSVPQKVKLTLNVGDIEVSSSIEPPTPFGLRPPPR
jgi:hypothetical protein